jgi:hypothetical protein
MEQLSIFSGTLGLSPPWQVTSVTFTKDSNRLDIHVEYAQLNPLVCPFCGAQRPSCRAEAETETWFHEDFFHYATYLHAEVPRLFCCCGVFPRPWCRMGSRFSQVPR